jgi:hypothetical protein
LGERLLCKQEVIGSIPFTSTIAQQREAMVCMGSRDSDAQGASRKRADQDPRSAETIVEVPDCRRLWPETVFFDR